MAVVLNWTKGDFECRTVVNPTREPYTELVKYNVDESGRRWCYTIAYFHKDKEGNVSLHFVGDRPFKEIAEIDVNDIWKELWLSVMLLEGNDEDNE